KNQVPSRPQEQRPLSFSLPMFEHARDHMHLHMSLIGTRGGTIARDTVRQVLSDLVRSELGAKACKDLPRELVVQYVVDAYMAVVTWWLDGGAKLAPVRIDAVFQRLVSEGVPNLSS